MTDRLSRCLNLRPLLRGRQFSERQAGGEVVGQKEKMQAIQMRTRSVQISIVLALLLVFPAQSRPILLGGNITTSGDQLYNSAVTLTNDTALTSTGGGAITFSSTVDGPYSLTVNTDGATAFMDAVGNSAPLASLTTDGVGTTLLNGGLVVTTGFQTYNDELDLGADTTLLGTALSLLALNGNNHALTIVNSDVSTFNGPASGISNLILNGSGLLEVNVTVSAGGVTVDNGATLGGNGTILASVAVQSGGTLSPGTSTGSLTVNNSLTLSGTALLEINKAGATNGQVRGTTLLSYGGALQVTNLDGTLAAGDSFELFQAALYRGAFANFSLPPLQNGLLWDTSGLATNGTIAVIQSLPSRITGIKAVAAHTIELTGTGVAGEVYYVWASTNLTLPLQQWWLLGATNASNSGLIEFTDGLATNDYRFYLLGYGTTDSGTHTVNVTDEGWVNPQANQTDLDYTNIFPLAARSYGSSLQSGAQVALYPATNTAVLADPLFEFTCDYMGTNLAVFTGSNPSVSCFHFIVDGDESAAYVTVTNGGTGWIHIQFSKTLTHYIRYRTEGAALHATVFRVMQGDRLTASAESQHRVNIIGFGDSHTDGNTSVGQMDTWVNRIHSHLAQYPAATFYNGLATSDYASVFGSALGGSGFLALGGSGFPYTNRFYNDVFVQQARPDILVIEGSNDYALITSQATSNAYAAAVAGVSGCIATNMPGSNVWFIAGPASSRPGDLSTQVLFSRDVIRSNCVAFGFNLVDFTGGATNSTDTDRGLMNSGNISNLWDFSAGHFNPTGKEWFAGIIASNIQGAISVLRQRK